MRTCCHLFDYLSDYQNGICRIWRVSGAASDEANDQADEGEGGHTGSLRNGLAWTKAPLTVRRKSSQE